MAAIYSNENFPLPVVQGLRALGHDVLTTQETGQAGYAVPDAEVLAYASGLNRAVLTLNRQDFIRLHVASSHHAGIIVCTFDPDYPAQAERDHRDLPARILYTWADLYSQQLQSGQECDSLHSSYSNWLLGEDLQRGDPY